VDPQIDEKGGLLLILTWVPWSEREWVQFLGRTARQDHTGQYAVFLDNEDDRVQDAMQDRRSDESLITAMLRIGDEDAVDSFERTQDEVQKGRLMHRLTSRFWVLEKQGGLKKDQIWKWKRLCESYLDCDLDEIQEKFDEAFPPEKDEEEAFDIDDGPKMMPTAGRSDRAGHSAASNKARPSPGSQHVHESVGVSVGIGPRPGSEPMARPGGPASRPSGAQLGRPAASSSSGGGSAPGKMPSSAPAKTAAPGSTRPPSWGTAFTPEPRK
jgi:hypothetical protein